MSTTIILIPVLNIIANYFEIVGGLFVLDFLRLFEPRINLDYLLLD